MADPDILFGGGHEAPRSSAVGAMIEAPKAPRGVRCGEGVSPSPLEVGSGERAVPLPRKCFQFFIKKTACFDRF